MTKFPVGFWNYSPLSTMSPDTVNDWAELGMTLTMSPRFDPEHDSVADMRAILDRCHEHGIRIIMSDARTYWRVLMALGRAKFKEGFRAAVADFGDHPAVYGFHVGDEPDTSEFPFACEAARIHKEIAPQFEPFHNLLPWYCGVEDRIGYMDFAKYLDDYVKMSGVSFLCYDCYSQMNPGESGWNCYFNNLRLYQEAASRNAIPYWTTLLSIGHFRYRTPNLDDFRWQQSTAAAHGAKGLLYFFLYMQQAGRCNYRNGPINELGQKTKSYYDLMETQRAFNDLYGDLLADATLEKVQHVDKTYGGFKLFEGDEIVKACNGNGVPLILSYFTGKDGKKYIALVCNSCTESAHFTMTLRGEKLRVLSVRGNERSEISRSPWDGISDVSGVTVLRDWLAPGQMRVITCD